CAVMLFPPPPAPLRTPARSPASTSRAIAIFVFRPFAAFCAAPAPFNARLWQKERREAASLAAAVEADKATGTLLRTFVNMPANRPSGGQCTGVGEWSRLRARADRGGRGGQGQSLRRLLDSCVGRRVKQLTNVQKRPVMSRPAMIGGDFSIALFRSR